MIFNKNKRLVLRNKYVRLYEEDIWGIFWKKQKKRSFFFKHISYQFFLEILYVKINKEFDLRKKNKFIRYPYVNGLKALFNLNYTFLFNFSKFFWSISCLKNTSKVVFKKRKKKILKFKNFLFINYISNLKKLIKIKNFNYVKFKLKFKDNTFKKIILKNKENYYGFFNALNKPKKTFSGSLKKSFFSLKNDKKDFCGKNTISSENLINSNNICSLIKKKKFKFTQSKYYNKNYFKTVSWKNRRRFPNILFTAWNKYYLINFFNLLLPYDLKYFINNYFFIDNQLIKFSKINKSFSYNKYLNIYKNLSFFQINTYFISLFKYNCINFFFKNNYNYFFKKKKFFFLHNKKFKILFLKKRNLFNLIKNVKYFFFKKKKIYF